MEGLTRQGGRRTLTPAVLASALFTAACAAFAITFVAARGGLQLPVAPGSSHVAVASPDGSAAPSVVPTAAATSGVTPPPIPTASPAATSSPTVAPTSGRTPAPTPAGSPDPLAALPGCPGIDGCYRYVVQRDDSLTGVASHYLIPVSVVRALNPEVSDPGTIVVGQTLYLGRSPFLRLPPCPDRPNCSVYEVQAGDRLSTIAGRFGLTLEAVLAANPEITDANQIHTGQQIRLPHPTA